MPQNRLRFEPMVIIFIGENMMELILTILLILMILTSSFAIQQAIRKSEERQAERIDKLIDIIDKW